MKKCVKCLAATRMFGSLYEAKQCGHKIVIPLDRRIVVIADDLGSMIDLKNITASVYRPYISEDDGYLIEWKGYSGSLLFIVKDTINEWVYKNMNYPCISQRNFIKEILE